jgi:hypothetical protein
MAKGRSARICIEFPRQIPSVEYGDLLVTICLAPAGMHRVGVKLLRRLEKRPTDRDQGCRIKIRV